MEVIVVTKYQKLFGKPRWRDKRKFGSATRFFLVGNPLRRRPVFEIIVNFN
jgi:hypothetical protein